ncbi:transposase [Pseudomonas cavernicola]|uniref:Transposase n=1 Tax=Pseudomonas cavernicola TaxID=2320866 RepID=A0A418XJI0_9PSED|nr:transposase [Pseudomonas cavernicola]RJG12585.1 transposase [Pseudomonas cavernicola]
MPVTALPQGNRLRAGRFSEAGRIYLLTAVVHNRQCLFADWRLGRLVAHELRLAEDLALARSLAWVVMPDHLHWLVELEGASLDGLMQRVKSRSAKAINTVRQTQGKIWQKGYHDHAVRREESLKTLARYVVANPLRAGLVERIGDYPLWDAIWL